MTRLDDLISPVLTRAQEHYLVGVIQTEQSTPQTEGAWEILIAAHQRAIKAAAGRGRSLDPEDAYGTALEAFVVAVREFDLDLGLRLSTMAYPAMAHAVLAAASADHPVVIPRGVVNRYLALMKKADGDFPTAYRMAQEGGHHITPFNLLTAHRAMSDPFDADEVLGGASRELSGAYTAELTGASGNLTRDALRSRGYTADPGHEEIDRGFIRDLFLSIPEEQDHAIRLALGFRSAALDALRVLSGFKEDEVLNDRELGVVLGTSRSTARRRFDAGITGMKDFVQQQLDAEENAA